MLTPTRHRKEAGLRVGFRAGRKAMYLAVETHAIENRFEVMIEKINGSTTKNISYICADHRTVVDGSGCTFRIDTERWRSMGNEELEVVLFEPNHGSLCTGGPIPTPSFDFLSKHLGLLAYAVHSKPHMIVKHASTAYNVVVSDSMASRLKLFATNTENSERSLSYAGIHPWLVAFCADNPGAHYHFQRNATTNRFESAALLLPIDEILAHSFLGTMQLDAGHVMTPMGIKCLQFVLTFSNRERRTFPAMWGWFDAESADNYTTFLALTKKSPTTYALVNRPDVAIIHDRHLSFLPAILAILCLVLNRIDIVHIIKNCRVSNLKLYTPYHMVRMNLMLLSSLSLIDQTEIFPESRFAPPDRGCLRAHEGRA